MFVDIVFGCELTLLCKAVHCTKYCHCHRAASGKECFRQGFDWAYKGHPCASPKVIHFGDCTSKQTCVQDVNRETFDANQMRYTYCSQPKVLFCRPFQSNYAIASIMTTKGI